jgi:hypothetical protein
MSSSSLQSIGSCVSEKRDSDRHEPPTALMVTAVEIHPMDDDEKAKIMQQAQADVENKLMSTAVQAEETTMQQLQEDKAQKRKQYIIRGVMLLLVVVGVVVGVVLATRGSEEQKLNPLTTSPTQSPSTLPPSNDFGDNTFCEGAYGLGEEIVSHSIISGTTLNSFSAAQVDTCEILSSNGNGVWFSLQGLNKTMMASTCKGGNFDSQISIFQGGCGRLQCVAGNDQISIHCGNGVSFFLFGFFGNTLGSLSLLRYPHLLFSLSSVYVSRINLK